MKKLTYLFVVMLMSSISVDAQVTMAVPKNYAIVVHGGAGGIRKGQLTAEEEQAYKVALEKAIAAGEEILKSGGKAVDAVEKAITMLEDDTLFNAGKGAVFAANEKHELDASIMNGADLNAGAVAGVTTIKNPILAARAVMDKSQHVMFGGKGAEDFAEKNGCEIVENEYFSTKANKARLEKAKKNEGKKSGLNKDWQSDKYGTVGAVAIDLEGNMAAGTSTGGMVNKKHGRIGDSPLIGSGTYADNISGAVSCTGWGEYFIRLGMAKAVCDRMELQALKADEAARTMIHDKLAPMGATGGVIVIDRYGNMAIDFNTAGMFRAWASSNGKRGVAMYGKDDK